MTSGREHLSKEQGLEIQRLQLADWKLRLNTACYEALVAQAQLRNELLEDDASGYDVWRGCNMDEFIMNWTPPTQT